MICVVSAIGVASLCSLHGAKYTCCLEIESDSIKFENTETRGVISIMIFM